MYAKLERNPSFIMRGSLYEKDYLEQKLQLPTYQKLRSIRAVVVFIPIAIILAFRQALQCHISCFDVISIMCPHSFRPCATVWCFRIDFVQPSSLL